ncbi:MAG TPA: hypothetical protein VF770_05340, partial [Solirubrobacterales bacterium]
MEEGAEAERRAPRHLVGERLGEQRPRLGRTLAREALEVGLDLQRPLQDRQRVTVDVEVVVGALLDAAQRLQLGQDDRRQPQLVEQLETAQRGRAGDKLAQLGKLSLPRRLGGARRFGAGQGQRAGLDLEVQLGREADGAQQPQRVGREAPPADDAQQPSLEVGEAAVGVERLSPGERDRDGAEREVARGQVGLDRAAAQRRDVDLPGAVGRRRPPARELGRELEGVAAAGPGDRLRGGGGIAAHGEVEVGDLAAERGLDPFDT